MKTWLGDDLPVLHPDMTYLHWVDDSGKFTGLDEEIQSRFGGLCFFFDAMHKEYPDGYKMWRKRKLADAPDWVRAVFWCRCFGR